MERRSNEISPKFGYVRNVLISNKKYKNSLEVAFIFCKSDLGQKLFNLNEDCFFQNNLFISHYGIQNKTNFYI